MKLMCTLISFRATVVAQLAGNTPWGTCLLAHPLVDDVELTVQRENSSVTDTFKVCPPHTI